MERAEQPQPVMPEDELVLDTGIRRQRLLLAIGLVALVAAAAFGVTTLRNNTSAAAGSDSPEGAVADALAALSNEDVLGAAELLLPAERRTMVEPGVEMVDELKRLRVLGDDFDLTSVSGIDLAFEDVQYEVEVVREDFAVVRLVGGETSAAFDPAGIAFGELVLAHVDPNDFGDATRDISQIEESDTGIAVLQHDGRWYVSLAYTAAEAARQAAGHPRPDPADALVPRGAPTAEAAVDQMVRAAVDLDLRRVLELLPPDEAAAIHDYAPLFLPDAEAAASSARQLMDNEGVTLELTRLDLTSVERSRGRLVQIGGFGFELASPIISGGVEIANGEVHATLFAADGTGAVDMHFADGCMSMVVTQRGQPDDTQRFCEDDVEEAMADLFGFGELPDFNIFSRSPVLGIMTVEVDGSWYVSPLGTTAEAQLELVAAIDPDKLAAVVDWIAGQAETAILAS